MCVNGWLVCVNGLGVPVLVMVDGRREEGGESGGGGGVGAASSSYLAYL
jgi:hypothetical protein